jgi:large subunit ribosomal protein L37Ae
MAIHMSKRTKKVGSVGRFGARYGVRIRKRIADVETVSKGRHDCPKCRANAMARNANGIWTCRKCGAKIASSSYMPTPPVAVRRELAEVLAKAEVKEEKVVEAEMESEELPKEADETADKPKKHRKDKE